MNQAQHWISLFLIMGIQNRIMDIKIELLKSLKFLNVYKAEIDDGILSVVVPYYYLFLLSVFILWFSYYVSDIFCKF